MSEPQIVLDTNVLVAAFRSRRGSSYRLFTLLDKGLFKINISVPLALEYEDVLSRPELSLSIEEVRDVVDYICAAGNRRLIHFLWRPFLNDPKDDMVLELAVTAGCHYILTFNERDFRDIERFGLRAVRPREFLRLIGDVP
jgi:predicted nucleic acid-binding protein